MKSTTSWTGSEAALGILLLAGAFLALSGCDLDDDNWGIIGTVSFVDVETGCWIIVADGGSSYEPVNLDDRFRVDGLRVRFLYRPEEDWISVCMIGEPVWLTRIEEW